MEIQDFYGRLVPTNQISKAEYEKFALVVTRLTTFIGSRCRRCNTKHVRDWRIPNGAKYCGACIGLGRISDNEEFWTITEPNQFVNPQPLTWEGQLTEQQQRVVTEVMGHQGNHLVWAVTGAGKTEMLFPIIEQALQQRKRVAVVAPRVDVVIELAPRLQAAFATTSMTVLHGRQTEPYAYTQLVLGTTHQLLRFRDAFDLLIIDEVDSFPFIGEPMLHVAARAAVKESGRTLYLSATPDHRTRAKKLTTSYLPLRFHGHLLPMIVEKTVGNWRNQVKRNQLPRRLVRQLQTYQKTGQRFLLFVPTVADLLPIAALIQKYCPVLEILTVHAKDEARLTKVQTMRDHNVQGLLTTTILERGVTFPDIDVLILGADDQTFSPNALVQIAGRAGRKPSRPTGLVMALVSSKSWRVWSARQQIIKMNHRGQQLQLIAQQKRSEVIGEASDEL
ncbi:DEAD/DEAH box helicase [Periweissella cryptocerci]|uniref:DEAD/DEAH box helicase n=1 Tax=Periweissella cryptocerci TaxID=2506420 RepID=A0A4P6YTD3_9LACO|nr:DEAD/DEAH box helicase family protein [Periweissella cryptocerci]QBO35913.1 DEAD/DEAH box helicase [Periweissella cryptocerci]